MTWFYWCLMWHEDTLFYCNCIELIDINNSTWFQYHTDVWLATYRSVFEYICSSRKYFYMMWEKYWYDNQVFDILGRRKKWDDDFLSVKAFFLLTLYNIQCFQLYIVFDIAKSMVVIFKVFHMDNFWNANYVFTIYRVQHFHI